MVLTIRAPSSLVYCFFIDFHIIIGSIIINTTNKHIIYNHHGSEDDRPLLIGKLFSSNCCLVSSTQTAQGSRNLHQKLKYYLWEDRLTKTPCVYCLFLQLVKSSQYFSCFIVVLKPALAPPRGSREMQCRGTTQIHKYTLKNHFFN